MGLLLFDEIVIMCYYFKLSILWILIVCMFIFVGNNWCVELG